MVREAASRPSPPFAERRLDLSMLDYEQIKREDIREPSSNAVLVIPIVRREEGSMISAHFAALAVHNFEQIRANVSNAPDLNERGVDPPRGGVRFTIANLAIDDLDELATRLALGERRRKLKNYLKHIASTAYSKGGLSCEYRPTARAQGPAHLVGLITQRSKVQILPRNQSYQ